MNIRKQITALILTAISPSILAGNYLMVAIDENGNNISSCGITELLSPIDYRDSSCHLSLRTVSGGDEINVDLGPCPTSHKLKIVLDDNMYKFNIDAHIYKDVFMTQDVLFIDANIAGCTGDAGDESDLQIYTTGNPDPINLDENFGIQWGHDSSGKPMVVMKSTSGNVVCNNNTPVVVVGGDVIFEDGFEG